MSPEYPDETSPNRTTASDTLEERPRSARLASLDAYRGFTMLAMASGGLGLAAVAEHFPESKVWQSLAFHTSHVPWVGCSAWDLIQPAFMFMVGVSMAYANAARRARGQSYSRMFGHALWRAGVLILLGVFLRSNRRPETYWTFEDVVSQIGMGYVFLFLLWGRGAKVQLLAAITVLAGYWALFSLWPLPGADYDFAAAGADPDWSHNLTGFAAHWNKNTNPAHLFDVWMLNLFPRENAFAYHGGGYHTLSFIPSLATMIFGLLAGELLRSRRSDGRKLLILIACGALGLIAGEALNRLGICPIVKRIWTPSWTLYSTGWCLFFLAGFFAVIDVWGFRRWAWPGIVVGMNSITMYIMAGLLGGWIRQTYHTHLGEQVFSIAGEAYEPFASRLAVLLVLWLVCAWMYRRRIFLRI